MMDDEVPDHVGWEDEVTVEGGGVVVVVVGRTAVLETGEAPIEGGGDDVVGVVDGEGGMVERVCGVKRCVILWWE